MSGSLPPRAHLDHLKKQAKDLLRAQRSGERDAAQRLRAYLTRLSGDEGTSAAPVSLQEAQYVVAREYGFANWAGLLEAFPSTGRESALQAVRRAHSRLVPDLQRVFTRPLGREAEVVIVRVHEDRFGVHVQSLEAFCWNYCFQLDGLEGGNLAFSLPLCAALWTPDSDGEEAGQRVEAFRALPSHEDWVLGNEYSRVHSSAKAMVPYVERVWGSVPDAEKGIRPRPDGIGQIQFIFTEPSLILSPGTARGASGAELIGGLKPTIPTLFTPTDPAIHTEFEIRPKGCEGLELSLCYLASTIETVLTPEH